MFYWELFVMNWEFHGDLLGIDGDFMGIDVFLLLGMYGKKSWESLVQSTIKHDHSLSILNYLFIRVFAPQSAL